MSSLPDYTAAAPRRSAREPKAAVRYADLDHDEPRRKRKQRADGKPAATTRKNPRRGRVDGAGAPDDNDNDICAEEPDPEELAVLEEEEEALQAEEADPEVLKGGRVRRKVAPPRKRRVAPPPTAGTTVDARFVGDPVPDDEARQRWPERYKPQVNKTCSSRAPKCGKRSKSRSEPEEERRAQRHFASATVENTIINLGDDVYVRAGPGEDNYIGRITEFFKGIDHGSYFCCRWFFRVAETVISPKLLEFDGHKHDHNRVFISEEKDDNKIDSIISKINVTYVGPNITPQAKAQLIAKSGLYYDMSYSESYSTFSNLPPENGGATDSETTSDISCDDVDSFKEKGISDLAAPPDAQMGTAKLLDLYSGCGAMSTGLCMGAALFGLKLSTKWAVDMNTYACRSLEHNHPDTKVRNEKADNFLILLRQWEALCRKYDVYNSNSVPRNSKDDEVGENEPLPEGTFEVEKLVDICYGDPNNTKEVGLWFKGCVDVICGGPPCQGISGLNRSRNHKNPLADEKNKQMAVFMEIVSYLRPRYVLMENVVDMLKFADGFLGCYAMSRLVAMCYQARLGMMVTGCYGLPQFRMRVFLWGALPSVALPKFALPTHDAINRGVVPKAFSQCLVACDETEAKLLEKPLFLRDAISDLPKVKNHQPNDAMEYSISPKLEFQRYIWLDRKAMRDYSLGDATPEKVQLFDHQPLQLNKDDYQRVKKIPKEKEANFRNLEGVRVRKDNTVEFDPDIPRVFLSSRKPLVPNYAMTFIKGRSVKPFGRLWWDETVATVVTRAEPHNQAILHPKQDRVLTVRENARLQGFPDYYKLSGPIKQKYIQVGNAVAIPVARTLGYSLGLAYQQQGESHGDQWPLFNLPRNFIPSDQAAASGTCGGGEVVEEE